MIHEKTLKPKISWHRPFKVLYNQLVVWGDWRVGCGQELVHSIRTESRQFFERHCKRTLLQDDQNNFMPPNVFQYDFDWSKLL